MAGGTNISAFYLISPDETVSVENSVTSHGSQISMYGKGHILEKGIMCVSFEGVVCTQPNYIIYFLLVDKNGDYQASIVSNQDKTTLFVLTRSKEISCKIEMILLNKINEYWDLDKVVRVKHL